MDARFGSNELLDPEAFKIIQGCKFPQILALPRNTIRCLLPCLVRIALQEEATKALTMLSSLRQSSCCESIVNDIVSLYEQVDFERVAHDAIKELRWRAKLIDSGDVHTDHATDASQVGSYVCNLSQRGSLTGIFEHSDSQTRVRIILSQLLRTSADSSTSTNFRVDDLFVSSLYTETIANIICIIYTELLPLLSSSDLPNGVQFNEAAFLNSVLRMRHSTTIVTRLIVNYPCLFDAVCSQAIDSLTNSSSSSSNETAAARAGELTSSNSTLKSSASKVLFIDPIFDITAEIDSGGASKVDSDRATHTRRWSFLLRSLAKMGGPLAMRRIREAVCVAARRSADRTIEELVLSLTLDLADAEIEPSSPSSYISSNSCKRDGLDELLSFVSSALLMPSLNVVQKVSDVALQSPSVVAETLSGALFESAPTTIRGSVSRRRTSMVTDAASPPRERDVELRSPKSARIDFDADLRSPKATVSAKQKGTSVCFQDLQDRLYAFTSLYATRLANMNGNTSDLDATLRRAMRLIRVLLAVKLNGVVGRLAEDELSSLLTLLTLRIDLNLAASPSTALTLDAFSTLCFCSLIALCGQLISTDRERRAADWLMYLIQDNAQPGKAALSECVESLLVFAFVCHAIYMANPSMNNLTAQPAWEKLLAFVSDLFAARFGFGAVRVSLTHSRYNPCIKAARLVVCVLTEDVLARCLDRFDSSSSLGGFLPPLACVTQLVARAGRANRDQRDQQRSTLPTGSWLLAHIVRAHDQLVNADVSARASAVQQLVVAIDEYTEALSAAHFTTAPRTASTNRPRVEPIREVDLVRNLNELALFRFGREVEVDASMDVDMATRFDSEPTCVLKHVLLTYYLMTLRYAYLQKLYKSGAERLETAQQSTASAASSLNDVQATTFLYSDRLLVDVPVVYLLRRARAERAVFSACLPELYRIAISSRPEMRDVDSLLIQPFDSLDPPGVCLTEVAPTMSFSHVDWCNEFNGLLQTDDPVEIDRREAKLIVSFDRLLERVRVSDACLVPLLRAVEAAVTFLSRFLRTSRPANVRLFERIREAWLRVHAVAPRKLASLTTRAFASESADCRHSDSEEFVRDPLLVARCLVHNKRLRELTACFELFLKTLQTMVTASRAYYNDLLVCNVPRVGASALGYQLSLGAALCRKAADREELVSSLLISQDAAVVHLLIEICCIEEPKEQPGRLTSDAEILRLTCAFLHAAFIEAPSLIKLVHFQGYPLKAVRTLVRFVPSVHCALEIVPELLSMPYRDTQQFGIHLTACLSERYAVPRAAQRARLCLDVMFRLIGVDRLADRIAFFDRSIDALVQFATAFPPLAPDCARLLIAVARSCCPTQFRKPVIASSESSRMVNDDVDVERDDRDFNQLTKMDVDEGADQDLLPELSDDASRLYTRIRRCYVEICKRSTMLQYLV